MWAGVGQVEEALRRLGMAPTQSLAVELDLSDAEWQPGGETFVYTFGVVADGQRFQYVWKACAPFFSARSAREVLDDWWARREALADCGVATPQVMIRDRLDWVERYVPMHLSDAWRTVHDPDRQLLTQSILAYVECVASLGFHPVDAFSDLRSHGTDVVAIDFGSDLGPFGAQEDRRSVSRQAIEWVRLHLKSSENIIRLLSETV